MLLLTIAFASIAPAHAAMLPEQGGAWGASFYKRLGGYDGLAAVNGDFLGVKHLVATLNKF